MEDPKAKYLATRDPGPRQPRSNPLRVWEALEAVARAEASKPGPAAAAWLEVCNAIREQLGDDELPTHAAPAPQIFAAKQATVAPTRHDVVGISRTVTASPAAAAPVPKTGRGRGDLEKATEPNTGRGIGATTKTDAS